MIVEVRFVAYISLILALKILDSTHYENYVLKMIQNEKKWRVNHGVNLAQSYAHYVMQYQNKSIMNVSIIESVRRHFKIFALTTRPAMTF